MTEKTHDNYRGSAVSIRTLNIVIFVATIVLAAMLLYAAMQVSDSYRVMHEATNQYIECQQDTQKMMEASDYLTDRVRCFVVTGDKQYVDDFFEEVNVTRRRDDAIESMETMLAGTETQSYLQEALRYSNELVNIENYAMRLAAEAYSLDLQQFPEEVRSVAIDSRHALLNAENQRSAAIDLVFNNEYQKYKSIIRDYVNKCSDALIDSARASHQDSSDHMLAVIHQQTLLLVILMLAVLGIVLFTTYLVLRPLQQAVQSIRENRLIPGTGAEEIQYLARSYNEMLESTRKEQETLSYEASHDALTGLSNRAMYERVRVSCDPAATTMILVDIDHFKEVNDTYGHETGDQLLKRVAKVLRSSFRSEDYVCRIGGDEFAVLMMNSDSSLKDLVRRKIETAQDQLRDPQGSVPGVTLSVGVAFPDREAPSEDIFQDADAALYRVKNAGRNGLAFY